VGRLFVQQKQNNNKTTTKNTMKNKLKGSRLIAIGVFAVIFSVALPCFADWFSYCRDLVPILVPHKQFRAATGVFVA
jgi:flagellar basal body-associated protein FliL